MGSSNGSQRIGDQLRWSRPGRAGAVLPAAASGRLSP